MLSTVYSCAAVGLEGEIVQVEVDYNPYGCPRLRLLGCRMWQFKRAASACGRPFVTAACSFRTNDIRSTSLRPACGKKVRPMICPWRSACWGATDQVPLHRLAGAVFVGELSLDGSVRHVSGMLPLVHRAWVEGYECIYVPEEDVNQAALVPEIDVIPVRSLDIWSSTSTNYKLFPRMYGMKSDVSAPLSLDGLTDFADVKGQTFF